MPSLNAARAFNEGYSPKSLPVALFLGGTAGIGLGLAQAFADATRGNCHIIILGRNRQAAETAISAFPQPTVPAARHEFIECDATLMANVRAAAQVIRSRVDKLNYLVTSPAFFATVAAEWTDEGIEKKLALLYYARMLMAQELMPLLNEAAHRGEDGTIFNVLGGAERGELLDRENLGLKKSYDFRATVHQPPTWTNLTMQHMAKENPNITFLHVFPGFVNTDLGLHGKSLFLKIVGTIATYMLRFRGISIRVAGDYMLYAMLSIKGGFKFVGSRGDEDEPKLVYQDQDKEVVWKAFCDATMIKR